MTSKVMQQCRWSYFELASLVALQFLLRFQLSHLNWNDSIKKVILHVIMKDCNQSNTYGFWLFFPLDRKDCKSMLEHDWKRHFLIVSWTSYTLLEHKCTSQRNSQKQEMRGQQEFLYINLPDVLNRWYKIKIGIRAENFCFNIASGVHLWRQHRKPQGSNLCPG